MSNTTHPDTPPRGDFLKPHPKRRLSHKSRKYNETLHSKLMNLLGSTLRATLAGISPAIKVVRKSTVVTPERYR